MKIERLLDFVQRPQPVRMLEIGIGYLAVPNRWMLTEPHYRLKFLNGWLHAWRTPCLRLMRKGTLYDCEPL